MSLAVVLCSTADRAVHYMQVMRHPAVAHALKLRQSLVYARFKVFFQLYAAAPNLGRALMDLCFVRVRFAALEIIVEACKVVKVKVQYLAAALGFWLEPASRAQPHVAAQPSAPTSEAPENSSNSMALPGCRHPSFGGKHPAEVRFSIPALCSAGCLAQRAWQACCANAPQHQRCVIAVLRMYGADLQPVCISLVLGLC